MLQTSRDSRLLWRRRKRRNGMDGFCCNKIYSTLMVIGCLTLLPQGLTQNNDDVYIVKPTPALHLGKGELTTVLLVNNENHGRYINVRPEVGLLTSTARTFIQEGVTTEYATQVVGTTLDNGRVYAQYLKKSSRVLYDSGVPMPSVVTSWVGESLQSDTDLLPQSHNDLFDADQPDWQAIDDRLLGDRRQKDNFVGNTDYVGARQKTSLHSSSKVNEEVNTPFGVSLNLGFANSKPAYNFVAQLGSLEENARKVAANKVLPIGDLPTYTIKRNYEPSAFVISNDESEGEGFDSDEVFGRNPKLIYKKLMQNSLKAENVSNSSPLSRPIIPASRSFATVTYYGFADFTTVVGDSVIVFSPSTSSYNQNYNAHITSIKGEATLGVSVPQGPSISKVPITIAQDVIEPTITQQSVVETSFERDLSSKGDNSAENSFPASVFVTEVEHFMTTEKEHLANVLETSEVAVQASQMEATSKQSSTDSVSSTVMLSRPSDEEILRIYNALANAKAENVEIKVTTTENTSSSTAATTSERSNVHQETSNVEIFGGATTIFFEDDPFANFVVPSTTNHDLSASSVSKTTSDSLDSDKPLTVSMPVADNKKVETPTSTTAKISETTTEPGRIIETTTDQPSTVPETNLHSDKSYTATTPGPISKKSSHDANSSPAIVPNVVIKEIDPDNSDEMLTDCISTSQVFLTQLPKTVTVLETVVITNASDILKSKTEIQQKIQQTFEIKEATKYYCIQPSIIQANQVESPTVKTTASVDNTKAVDTIQQNVELESTEKTKEQEEDRIESAPTTTTEENSFDISTEGLDLDQKQDEDTTEHSGHSLSNVNDNEQDEDEDIEASGQPEEEDEEDEEIELIYKTLYTTYTYLTTFFHDDFTSISSHTEVVTNIMTSTLGLSSSKESTANLIANLDDNEINPTGTVNSLHMESTKRFVVPTEVENFIRTDEETDGENLSNGKALDDSSTVSKTETLATFYTTYTYYTTIFAEGETEIMSHTEIVTNVKKSTGSADSDKIEPTASTPFSQNTASPSYSLTTSAANDVNRNILPASETSSTSLPSSMLVFDEMAKSPNIPDLGDLSAITLVTDVRSSSSPGNKQIINNIEARITNDKFSQQHESVFEDQISSESNTDADEIIPSATLLLQTSFTTFTYYTTMYSGDKTNVISRLETMTNTVTETLQPQKTIDLEGASLPITYFTTFTYWTKLAREGQITTLSREETISNVILPTLGQHETQSQIEKAESEGKSATTEMSASADTLQVVNTASTSELDSLSNTETIMMRAKNDKYTINVLEPTTYYTTYTYYTTSYEADKTITDSRFETVTNIVTDTITETTAQNADSITSESPVFSTSAAPTQAHSVVGQSLSDLVLYDFKKIIDADGISTIFFTTEIKPTINADGVSTEVISSSSSLFIDEEKRNIQATASTENLLATLGPDGQPQKHYKTGLVRLIEGTRIANHTTTLYQSKVIGTIIDQRYAQIIESTSSFIFEKIKAATDTMTASSPISPTSSRDTENIQATERVSIPLNRPPEVEGSIMDNSSELEIETTTKPEVEQDEESSSKIDEKLRLPFQTKKPSFISPLKPFSNRSRPQFAPKKNSSATIITRSDFTPTITATPALKTLNRFSSSRRGSASGISGSNSALLSTSSRRFGRPNKSSASGAAIQASAVGFSGGSRNRVSSSSHARNSFASSSRRLGGSATVRPSFSRPSLFSSGFPGNSRARVRASSTVDLSDVSSTADISSSVAISSQEEDIISSQDDPENEEDITTESNRRQNNPLLRLRRPLNRPQGFSPARPQSNSPNNAVSLRRNPLLGRARSGNSVTTTTTTTTSKPKARTFQPPLISQNRIRPTSSLFPPRNIFGIQKPQETTEDNRDASEEDTNENNDDSEYEDDDDEESDGDDEDENSRRRRSNSNGGLTEIKRVRQKREAESSQPNRSNFRNRFRRPKLALSAQSESKNDEDDATENKEPVTTSVPVTTTSQRTRSRFGNRFSGHSPSSSHTTTATSAAVSSNHKAIRPTRPTNNSGGRAQFTLREKDSSVMSTTQKGSSFVKRPAFRKPHPGGSLTTRRLPSSTVPSSSTSGKRRLKSYTNNDSTTSRNSVTGRSRSSTTSSGRSRSSSSSRDNNIGGRNRGRTNNNYNNNEGLILDNGGSITVTHVIPAEVTIPVVNGKVTEYKQVITAKTSTEVLGPQQYTTFIAGNGLSQLALTREDSSVNYNGATEITKYVLHETSTTTITFTPTTIRGRKTSFSHVLPSTVYSVEQIVSTVQPQIAANAPLANILLSQLLLGNVGLPAANPLLALGGALTQPGTDAGPPQPATPVTEYKTHISTYVTTLFEGQSTVLPITFQGKKILTTIFDTTAQTITATEFITDTIVTTPTVMAQQPVVNSLLLQQLLLQQHLQQQQQQLQQPTPDSLNAILNSVPPQFLLGGDNLQELEASNNIRGSGHSEVPNEDDDFTVGSSADLDDIALQAQAQTHKSGRKKTRKNGKSHKRKNNNNADSHHMAESSVITLYVSGRRPGEFSTVLSTVQVRPDSTQYKRHAHTIDSHIDYLNDGSEVLYEYLPLPPEIVLLDKEGDEKDKFEYGNVESDVATQSLESIVGDVRLWFATQTTETKTNTVKLPQPSKESILLESPESQLQDPMNSTSQEIHKQSQHFDSGQDATKQNLDSFNTSYDYSNTKNKNDKRSGVIDNSQNDDVDEARYNLATRIMSNGVEVIIASDKTKTPDYLVPDISNSQQQHNKPMTLAASTIKNQMMILLFPSSNSASDHNFEVNHSTQQFNYNLPFHTNHFITKTCLTTYTYRTTYVQDGHTTVESREKVISNIATEERNYPKITPTQAIGVTLTKTPELAVGIFPTTYSYFNTFKDNNDKLEVMTSEYTVVNTITGPNEYVAYLQPTAKATPALKTNTYYDKVTLSQKIKSKLYTMTKNLTQVVVTKSYTPAYSTSVLTTYYAYDDDDAKISNLHINSPIPSLLANEGADVAHKDITKNVDNMHIYATKAFLTTFTYYTTTVLNSFLADKTQSTLGIMPLSTVFNYYTRVIENVITENVPATLLPNELVTQIKMELKNQEPNHRRRPFVTTATLKDGQTIKISAMEIYKDNLESLTSFKLTPSAANVTPSSPSTAESVKYSQEESADQYFNEAGDIDENEDLNSEESSNSPPKENTENVKRPENTDEEANGLSSLPSEQIFTVVEAPNTQTSNQASIPVAVNDKPTNTAANQLIQRLTALKPMFNAMADLLQNNFGVAHDVIKPVKNTESKQAPIKKINSSTGDTKHPIYIPVEKSPVKKSPLENFKFSELIPQSLHIKPPLLANDENTFEMNDRENSNIIHMPTSTAARQEQPLHNGGIYIRPGEIITANSDVIVGKPNGIEYAQLPKHNPQLHSDKNISKAYLLDNRQFQVTYYHNKVQHPYKKKTSSSALPAITHKPQHIPILNNKFISLPTYGLRPPSDPNFNKNILKPPPPPPIPLTHQSSIPLHSQQGLSLILTVPEKTVRIKQQTSANANSATDSSSPPYAAQQLPALMHKKPNTPPSAAPPTRGPQNYYSFNNELKNNEILEIQHIPQVFSVDLKPSSAESSNAAKLSDMNRKPQRPPPPQNPEFSPHFKTMAEKTSTNWQNDREQQTLSSFMNLQPDANVIKPEPVTTSVNYYPKISPSSNWKSGREPQIKSSTSPASIKVDQNTNLGIMEKAPQAETSLQSSPASMWNMQNGYQAQIYSQFSSPEKEENTISLQKHHNLAPALNRQKRPPAKLLDMDIFFKGFPPSSNIKLFSNPSSYSVANNENEKNQKQTITYPNDSVTKNHHNISLDQHTLSHTVDVNVPPLTFNREDHDYPQQAATAVRGQIPPSTVKTLNTHVDNTYKYMPLITIPANEQQVQVSLTPSNSISALTHPLDVPDNPSWKNNVTNNDNSNNIVRKISLVNDNFKFFSNSQDQKTLATTNTLNSRPKTEINSNWKHHRRQPLTGLNRLNTESQVLYSTSKPIQSTQHNSEEHNFKTQQHLKSTIKPFRKYQHTKLLVEANSISMTTVPPAIHAHTNLKFTYLPQSPSQTLKDDLNAIVVNKSDWSIPSLPYTEVEKEHKDLISREQQSHRTELAKEQYRVTRVPTRKTDKFGHKTSPTKTTTTKSSEASTITTQAGTRTTATTLRPKMDLNQNSNSNSNYNDSLHVSDLVASGEPFRKSLYNKRGENNAFVGVMHNQTKSAPIFVAPGEAFQTLANKHEANVKLTTMKPKQSPTSKIQSLEGNAVPKDIFATRESQYPVQTNPVQTKGVQSAPAITSKPSKSETKVSQLNIKSATTETVLGMNPPPLTLATNLNPTSKIPLPNSNKNSPAIKQTLQPNAENKVTLNKNDNILPAQKSNLATSNNNETGAPNTKKTVGNSKDKYITTAKTLNGAQATKPKEHELRKPNESTTMRLDLQPSEHYEKKISAATTSPLAQSVFTLTTTTTTTVKRIVLPTKYLMNKRVYTVTTTAPIPPPQHPASSSHPPLTSILSTTETTTEVTTLFLTHTKINTIIDTVTTVKTLEPVTVTATTTINSLFTESPYTDTPSVKLQVHDLASAVSSSSSAEPETPQLDPDLTYLPYPSVEVVSTNVTQEPQSLNPDENSIFIIMTNNKKNAVFTHHSTLAEDGVTSIDAAYDNNVGKMDETNEVMIEYDNRISFDDVPIRDEEPEQIVNGKSIASSAFVNNAASSVRESSSSDDHVILGGVLIATPPKFPNRQQTIANDSTISGCHLKCKTSRNEQCGLVDSQWSCFCRPGFARMFPDRPCKPTYTYGMQIHSERIGNYPLQYVAELKNNKTEHYKQLSQLVNNALDRMIMQSDFRDAYHGVEISSFADGQDYNGILINVLLQLSDNSNEKRLEEVFKKNLRLSNFSIGGTDLYTNKAGVDALEIKDFNECLSRKLHDCSDNAHCFNLPGTYTCSCVEGFVDLSENPFYPGRICSSEQIGCEMCHYHGKCSTLATSSYDRSICECFPWYAGSKCQVNLKILLIVLLGIGTLLFILLLFCILITCTKRRNHLQHTALAPSTVTTSSGGLQKNTRLAANMVITSVGLRNSLRGLSLKNTKRQKSIKIDKRSMIKDSSSETSQNSLPYILKNKESLSDGCSKKKKHSKMYRNCMSQGNTIEQYLESTPSNIQVENQSDLNTVITTSSSFKGNNKRAEQQNLLRNANEYEGHYCEQSDRSLTVMIPRAKYHSSVLPQKQLMHHQLTMERVHKSSKPESLSISLNKEADVKKSLKKSISIIRTEEDKQTELPTNPGALISAGFEVSAIVRDKTTIDHFGDQHNDLVLFDSIPPNYTLLTSSDPTTSADSDSEKKLSNDRRQQQCTMNKKFSINESDYNVYKCEKDLIETMDEWLGNVKLKELSAEARSFDETTILATTKPLRISIDGNQPQQLHNEMNTMAERDLDSTFLLPHTHLYKPERQESELSGFDSY